MNALAPLMTSNSVKWNTPKDLYAKLDAEFHFNFDPCPQNPEFDGLKAEWGTSTFLNQPYGRKTSLLWSKKTVQSSRKES